MVQFEIVHLETFEAKEREQSCAALPLHTICLQDHYLELTSVVRSAGFRARWSSAACTDKRAPGAGGV